MTRKDFDLIASLLKAFREAEDLSINSAHEAQYAHDYLAQEFAARLRSTNQQFNREKFLRACGVCP